MYYKPIYIDNTGGSEQTYYQVLLNVTYSTGMQTDFDDLRVKYYNGDEWVFVPYWIEDKVNDEWCKLWFNATYIPANSWCNNSYRLYYGDNLANSESNGSNTFLFYDDFTSGTLTIDNSGDPIIAYKSIPEIQNQNIEMNLKIETKKTDWEWSWLGYRLKDVSTNNFIQSYYYTGGNKLTWYENGVSQWTVSGGSYNSYYQFYTVKIRYKKNTEFRQITLENSGNEKINISHSETTSFYPDQFMLAVDDRDGGSISYDSTNDCYRLVAHQGGLTAEQWVHRVFIRKFDSLEPSTKLGNKVIVTSIVPFYINIEEVGEGYVKINASWKRFAEFEEGYYFVFCGMSYGNIKKKKADENGTLTIEETLRGLFIEGEEYCCRAAAYRGNSSTNPVYTDEACFIATSNKTLKQTSYGNYMDNLINISSESNVTTWASALSEPYKDRMGMTFFGIIFVLPFIAMWIRGSNTIIPSILGLILGGFIWAYMPEKFVHMAYLFIIISIAGVIYGIFRQKV